MKKKTIKKVKVSKKEETKHFKQMYKELANDANQSPFGIYLGDGVYLKSNGELGLE